MKFVRIGTAVFVVVLAGSLPGIGSAPLDAQVTAGVVLDRDGLRHFHVAIGSYYGIPVSRLASYPRRYSGEELAVVHLLAREARVSPETVIALRERGWAWIDVAAHLRIDPRIFVRHLPSRQGPPYGQAHGYWRKREAGHLTRLSDREIVDFVNVRLVHELYGYPSYELIEMRDRGVSFARMHDDLQRGRPIAEGRKRPVPGGGFPFPR